MACRRRKLLHEIELLLTVGESNFDLELCLLDTFSPGRGLRDEKVSLENFSDDECWEMFRFRKEDLKRLSEALRLPEVFHCENRSTASCMEGLLVLLRRLSYPNRWCDLVEMFQRDEPELSLIFNTVLDYIFENFGNLLSSLPNLSWLDVEEFSQAVTEKGAPLNNCIGFIDGTARPIARPSTGQGLVFSGHKRVHCLKFQSIQAPNGLVAHMYGPIEGRRHDAFMLAESHVLPQLEQLHGTNGEIVCVYGDPAYPLRPQLMAPFKGANLTEDQHAFNRAMSSVRVCVEWGFGKLTTLFSYLDFKKNQKVLLQPLGKYFLVATLLTNCHTCLYGSETTSFFDVQPPTLEAYLSNGNF